MPDDPTREEFREAASRFASGLVVVTCVVDGTAHAMTASSFVPLSLDPLLTLVAVERSTRFHDAVVRATDWAVSVLAEQSVGTARWFATKGRPLTDQFAEIPHRSGRATGAPLIEGALAALECRTVDIHPAGDHVLLVGHVLTLDLPEQPQPPLLYHRRQYRTLGPPTR